MNTIRVSSPQLTPSQLKEALSSEESFRDLVFVLEKSRHVDPEILIALISGGTPVLVALIHGAFSFATKRAMRRVTVVAPDGSKISAPANMKPDAVAEWIKHIKAPNQVIEIVIGDE